jgi:shikimate kinase
MGAVQNQWTHWRCCEIGEVKMTRGIYLVGFSGSGKSTIARLIGEKIGWPASDLDAMIVAQSGLSIPEIFEIEGEPEFRRREADALRAASSNGPFIVATGGGTIVREDNRAYMAENGWIICLEAKPQTILARILKQVQSEEENAVRPLLNAVDPLEQIRNLKKARQLVYGEADWTIHTDRLSREQVVAEVIRAAELLSSATEPIAAP